MFCCFAFMKAAPPCAPALSRRKTPGSLPRYGGRQGHPCGRLGIQMVLKYAKTPKRNAARERTRNGKKAETGRSRSRYPLDLPPQDGGAGGRRSARTLTQDAARRPPLQDASRPFFAEKQIRRQPCKRKNLVHPAMPGLSLQKFPSHFGRFAQSGNRTETGARPVSRADDASSRRRAFAAGSTAGFVRRAAPLPSAILEAGWEAAKAKTGRNRSGPGFKTVFLGLFEKGRPGVFWGGSGLPLTALHRLFSF